MGFQETFNERVIPAGDRAFGVSATLTHGAFTTDTFTATWEDLEHQIIDQEGFVTNFRGRVFMFPVTAATDGTTAFEPREGDRIAITENGIARQYEVVPAGDMPAVEVMAGGYRYRVRTKQVA